MDHTDLNIQILDISATHTVAEMSYSIRVLLWSLAEKKIQKRMIHNTSIMNKPASTISPFFHSDVYFKEFVLTLFRH